MRYIIHNGEINTIGGNAKWVKARESAMASPLFGEDLRRVFPVVEADGSDSAMLDEYLAFLLHAGYSLPQACMTAIPQPYENDPQMDPALRDFYAYTDCLSEPWDGPAAVAFTDGRLAGAMLDRNGPGVLPGIPVRKTACSSLQARPACATSRTRMWWKRDGCNPARCCWWIPGRDGSSRTRKSKAP